MRVKAADISTKRDLARQLRHQQTLAEQKMWWLLRSRAFNGYKFCRQYLIGPFIVDFCCRKRKLVIELDGSQHADNQDYDRERTFYLQQRGYRVLRFWNRDLLNEQNQVLEAVFCALTRPPGTLSRLIPGEGKSSLAFSRGKAGEGGHKPDEGEKC
jgi:very-short-patch-repair endonuclease